MYLARGSRGEYVKFVQGGLCLLYRNDPGIDGIFGRRTEALVKQFQSDNLLEADGIVGNRTWAELKSHIREFQRNLKEYGYYHGAIDGIAGPETVAAGKKYLHDSTYA